MIEDEKKAEYLKSLARPYCQRKDCARPAVYAVVFDYPCLEPAECEDEKKRHHLGSSVASCEECRPFFLEKILPELVRDLVARGMSEDLQFSLLKIENES